MPSRRNIRCLRAEVRLDDRRVSDDLLRCPLRDRAPLLQHEDPVGHAQDGPHHVLDDHGPEPDLRLHPLEHLDGVPHLIRGKARERLVEQEEAGPRREGAPELEPLLLLDREGGSEGVRAGLELDETEDSLDLFGKVRPFTHGARPPNVAATRTFSRTVRPANGLGIWWVFATPARTTRYPGRRSIRCPSRKTPPDVGRIVPERTFRRVVFPEPFGPIRPRTVPWSRASDTSSSAVTPPNRLTMPFAARRAVIRSTSGPRGRTVGSSPRCR